MDHLEAALLVVVATDLLPSEYVVVTVFTVVFTPFTVELLVLVEVFTTVFVPLGIVALLFWPVEDIVEEPAEDEDPGAS